MWALPGGLEESIVEPISRRRPKQFPVSEKPRHAWNPSVVGSDIILDYITSYHAISDRDTTYHILMYHVLSEHIISHHIYHTMRHHITPYLVISHHIISYHFVSYHDISCVFIYIMSCVLVLCFIFCILHLVSYILDPIFFVSNILYLTSCMYIYVHVYIYV